MAGGDGCGQQHAALQQPCQLQLGRPLEDICGSQQPGGRTRAMWRQPPTAANPATAAQLSSSWPQQHITAAQPSGRRQSAGGGLQQVPAAEPWWPRGQPSRVCGPVAVPAAAATQLGCGALAGGEPAAHGGAAGGCGSSKVAAKRALDISDSWPGSACPMPASQSVLRPSLHHHHHCA
jgi:hypothetical protein